MYKISAFECLGEIYKVDVKEPPQGVTPPSQSLKKQQRRQMRRFIAKNSAGLRVRTNPSLQSEQIGIVQPEGIISFIDEVKLHCHILFHSNSLCAWPKFVGIV